MVALALRAGPPVAALLCAMSFVQASEAEEMRLRSVHPRLRRLELVAVVRLVLAPAKDASRSGT